MLKEVLGAHVFEWYNRFAEGWKIVRLSRLMTARTEGKDQEINDVVQKDRRWVVQTEGNTDRIFFDIHDWRDTEDQIVNQKYHREIVFKLRKRIQHCFQRMQQCIVKRRGMLKWKTDSFNFYCDISHKPVCLIPQTS